jgi:anti-sigma factor RsiW
MSCPLEKKKGEEILLDYCAHTLEPARALEFEKHIESCADCRRAVEAQSEVWQLLGGWKPAPVPADFDARLYARIAREAESPAWRRWLRRILNPAVPVALWKPAVPIAVACAVLAVGFLVRTPDVRQPAQQIRVEKVDIEQVERTLEDLDLLTPASAGPSHAI